MWVWVLCWCSTSNLQSTLALKQEYRNLLPYWHKVRGILHAISVNSWPNRTENEHVFMLLLVVVFLWGLLPRLFLIAQLIYRGKSSCHWMCVCVCVCVFVQCDCPRSQKQITTEQAFSFAKEQGFVRCFKTSVKDGTNINEALEWVPQNVNLLVVCCNYGLGKLVRICIEKSSIVVVWVCVCVHSQMHEQQQWSRWDLGCPHHSLW